jgi:hypothetical protein
MKNGILALVMVFGMVTSAISAESRSIHIECESKSYKLVYIDSELSPPAVNYAVKGVAGAEDEISSADIVVEKFYLSDRLFALTLMVDGQSEKIELVTIRKKKVSRYFSKGAFFMKFPSGTKSEAITCSEQ